MVLLHLAGRERGRDYGPLIRFLWEAYQGREESRTSPLMHDDFERQQWDRGAHLLYRGATTGLTAFQDFQASWPRAKAAGRFMSGRSCPPRRTRPGSVTAWIGP